MVFARSVNRIEAVAGVKDPPDRIARPHRGWANAIRSHIPENPVEYTDKSRVEIESHFVRGVCKSRTGGQESRSSFRNQHESIKGRK